MDGSASVEAADAGFRMPGYPLVPAFFVLAALFAVVSTVWSGPRNAALGAVIIASGVPAFLWWRRAARRRPPA